MYRENVACDFCSQTFDTHAEKSAHIMDHLLNFHQELCTKCNQNLLQIGERLYVLHGTITCIDNTLKQEPIEDDTGYNEQNNGYIDVMREMIEPIEVCDENSTEVKMELEHISLAEINIESNEETEYEPVEMDAEATQKTIAGKVMIAHDNEDERFSCDKCGSTNLSERTWKYNHINPNYMCHICREAHCKVSALRTHYQKTHPEANASDGLALHRNFTTIGDINARTAMKTLKCSVEGCDAMLSRGTRPQHMARRHGIGDPYRFNCNVCGFSNLTRDAIKCHAKKDFKCSLCDKIFCLRKNLTQHNIEMHYTTSIPDSQSEGSKNIEIDECIIASEVHTVNNQEETSIDCKFCQQTFKSKDELKIHIAKFHDIETNPRKKRYTCNVCELTNVTKDTLKIHFTNQIGCNLCDKRFCLKTHLKKHYIDVHNDGIVAKKTRKKYECSVDGCNKIIDSSTRKYHMAVKHNGMQLECDICGKTYPTKVAIAKHIMYKHVPSNLKFKCELCDKKYYSKGELKTHHKFSHIKAMDFVCSECGVAFSKKHSLISHMTKHTGEKPFKCTFEGCSMAFRLLSRRTEHMRSHTGETPFHCNIDGCDKKFKYNIDFRRHKFNAHGIFLKKFPCQICSAVFPENLLLKKHMKKHGIQPQ